MTLYLIKSSLCLMLLWVFYRLFLEKENIHFLKRYYLLFSLVFAFTIPLITLTYAVEVISQPEVILHIPVATMVEPETIAIQEPIDYMSIILWSIYGIGALIFGIRFIRNIIKISKKIKNNEQLKESSHTSVLLNNSIVPHTFLKYIFVPKNEFQKKNIPEEVLLHEKTHVLQKHTLDILFVEVLQVIFWFNPVFILIKKSIKLNHEFLADQSVLKQEFSIHNYIDLLLNYPNSPNQAVLSSPINYSLTKKRLQMMTQEFSKKRVVLKLTACIPIIGVCILFFNNEIVAKEVELPLDEIVNISDLNYNISEETSLKTTEGTEKNTSEVSNLAYFQDGVTQEMQEKYNQWVRAFRTKQKETKDFAVSGEEVEKMRAIYHKMNPDQKNQSEKFPEALVPPPAPTAPPIPPDPKLAKDEKNNIPLPPTPPKAPSQSNENSLELIQFSGKSNLSEEEKQAIIRQVEEVYEKRQEVLERELERIEEEKAAILESEIYLTEAAQNLEEHHVDSEQAAMQRALAIEHAQEARERAMEARKEALEHAHMARSHALEAASQARELAQQEAMKHAHIARSHALGAAKSARKAALEAQKTARKAELQGRSARLRAQSQALKHRKKAEKNSQKAQLQARKAEKLAILSARQNTPKKVIKEMAKKDADFYYNGKKITAKKALKLVEKSNNLSINASTNNGKSKVMIKD